MMDQVVGSGRLAVTLGVFAMASVAAMNGSAWADGGGVAGPGADFCAEAVPVSGTGPFSFNNQFAEPDGPAHLACNFFGNDSIDKDVWFAWFAPSEPCENGYIASVCGRTTVDTKIAVYEGATCPPTDPLNCSDDDCGPDGRQTRVLFQASPDGVYLIRIGVFPGVPGGSGQFTVICAPDAPNDNCDSAVDISGTGDFPFDNTTANADGPAHADCSTGRQPRVDHDVWYCWTAPCTDRVFLSTCGRTAVDTKVAVYRGCDCPADEGSLAACSDDGCATSSDTQSTAMFDAVQGQQYLVRIGTFQGAEGGIGQFNLSCGLSSCPRTGSCFTGRTTPGCDNDSCCERVCAEDPFCCETRWDAQCATRASGVCQGSFNVCGTATGSCTAPAGNAAPGCSDAECCNAVCDVDRFCCLTQWDSTCAEEAAGICGGGFDSCGPGQGSCTDPFRLATPGCEDEACCNDICAVDPMCCTESWDQVCSLRSAESCQLACGGDTGDCFAADQTAGCSDESCCSIVCDEDPFCCLLEWDALCVARAEATCAPVCPSGVVAFVDPPGDVVYAGFATHPITGQPVGISEFEVQAPAGANPRCWELCETAAMGPSNDILEVLELSTAGAQSSYLIRLIRPITPNAVTTLSYHANDLSVTTGEFTSHMGNVAADGTASFADVTAMIDCCLNGNCAPYGEYSCDIDRSGAVTPLDIINLIDALNGAGPLDPTLGTNLPNADGICPAVP